MGRRPVALLVAAQRNNTRPTVCLYVSLLATSCRRSLSRQQSAPAPHPSGAPPTLQPAAALAQGVMEMASMRTNALCAWRMTGMHVSGRQVGAAAG
jgi:hypothetical protein